MKFKSITMALAATVSTAGTSMAAQSLAKDYVQSVHTQAKINTQAVQPWHKGYQPEVQTWSKLNARHLKSASRMYNHGIKRA